MIEVNGKYTNCKIFNDEVDKASLSQVYSFLNHPAFEGKKTRFMPDIHAGAGAVIGTTVELGNKVIPNVIGVDIGCGMLSYNIGNMGIDFPSLDNFIRTNIPSGMHVYGVAEYFNSDLQEKIIKVSKRLKLNTERNLKSVGTLGGGNHFIEVGIDEIGDVWITVHSGSRNFGLQIAKYHQKIAEKFLPTKDISEYLKNIDSKSRQKAKEEYHLNKEHIPKGMEYLTEENYTSYFEDMKIAQEFASESRKIMLSKIVDFFNVEVHKRVESIHNYIDFEDRIIRKGAISAHKGQELIIPWNMRDGLIIGKGKGNSDWNYSAPHGAGRLMSRSKAREKLSVEEFGATMDKAGIFTTCVGKSTLDESPMAYKDHELIEMYLEPTVEILHRVKPLYNFKAS